MVKLLSEFLKNIGQCQIRVKMRRIVLDTNCLLAVLPSRSPYHNVWGDFLEGKLELCVSTETMMEYEEILSAKTSTQFADIIMKTLINMPNLIKVTPAWHFNLIESDPDDNKFVDCAVCGQAEYIVSNDHHFDVLNHIQFPQLRVLTLQEFSTLL